MAFDSYLSEGSIFEAPDFIENNPKENIVAASSSQNLDQTLQQNLEQDSQQIQNQLIDWPNPDDLSKSIARIPTNVNQPYDFDNTLNPTLNLNQNSITPASGLNTTNVPAIGPLIRRAARPESEMAYLRQLAQQETGLVPGIIHTKPQFSSDQNRGGDVIYDEHGQLLKRWMEVNGNDLIKPVIDGYNALIDNIPGIISSQIIYAQDRENKDIIYWVRVENVRVLPPARETQGGNPTYCANYGKKFAALVVGDIVHYKPEDITENGRKFTTHIKELVSPDEILFEIPLMVGSKIDPTVGLSALQLEQYQMSIGSPKGYFIVDGAPRILISQQRGRFNQIIIQDHKVEGKLLHDVYLTAMSDAGSEQVTLRYDKDNGIGYRFRHTSQQINVWWIIRIVAGMASYVETANDYEGGKIAGPALRFIELANDYEGGKIAGLVLSFVKKRNHSKVSSILNSNISSAFLEQHQDPCWGILKQGNTNMKEEDFANERNKLLTALNDQLFPNVKKETYNYTRRIYTLALMTARLAERMAGVREPHEMDNWGNRRVDTPGQLLEVFIIRLWADHVRMANTGKTTQMWARQTNSIKSALKLQSLPDDIWNSLKQQKWLLNQKSKNHENVVQLPKFPNILAFLRRVSSVNISVNRDNPNQKARYSLPSSTGYFDPNDVPDGKSCGLMLRMTVLSKLSLRRPEGPIRDIVDRHASLSINKTVDNGYKPCILNGKFMGWAIVEALRAELRDFKMRNKYYHDIEVVYVVRDDILLISTDATRPIRPVLVVVKHENEYKLQIDLLSKQYGINLWTADYVDVQSGQIVPVDDFLIQHGAIEYISPLEQINAVIAQTSRSLKIKEANYIIAQEQFFSLSDELLRIEQLEKEQPELFETTLKVSPCYPEWQETILYLIQLKAEIIAKTLNFDNAYNKWQSYSAVIAEIVPYISEVNIKNTSDISQWIDHIESITCEHVKEVPSEKILESLTRAKDILNTTEKERHYDYCEIDPAGTSSIVISHISSSHMSEGYRQAYAASQATQALGHVPLGEMRVEAEPRLLYPQPRSGSNPIQDISGMNQYPTGQRVIVAVVQLGYNQEDATLTYAGAVERGLFMYELQQKYNDLINMHDEFVNPLSRNVGLHKPHFYANIESNGLPIVGSLILSGHCIIGKVIKDAVGKYRDASTYMKNGSYGIVRRVITQGNQVRVEISSVRYPQSGDKFAYDAQKSVAAKVLNTEDMPWIMDERPPGKNINMNGVKPTLIINPLSFPSRMTNNYLSDILMGTVSTITGIKYNNSSYREIDIGTVKNILMENGYNSNGLHTMYNPTTGERMVSEILIGPSHYDSLSHLAEKKHQSLGVGALSKNSMQPVEKKGNRGLRLGEMELSGLAAHGAKGLIDEKYGSTHNSSGGDCIDILVCKQCALPTSDTRKFKEPSCEYCSHHKKGQTSIFAVVQMPYIMNTVRLILQGLGINMKFKTSADRSSIYDRRILAYLDEIKKNPDVDKRKVKYLVDNLIKINSFESFESLDVGLPENLLQVSSVMTEVPETTKGLILQDKTNWFEGQMKGQLYGERSLYVDIGANQGVDLSEKQVDESSLAASSSSSSSSFYENTYTSQLSSISDLE